MIEHADNIFHYTIARQSCQLHVDLTTLYYVKYDEHVLQLLSVMYLPKLSQLVPMLIPSWGMAL